MEPVVTKLILRSGTRLVVDARVHGVNEEVLASLVREPDAAPVLVIEGGIARLRLRVVGSSGDIEPTLRELEWCFYYLLSSAVAPCPWSTPSEDQKPHPGHLGEIETCRGVVRFFHPIIFTGNRLRIWLDGRELEVAREWDWEHLATQT